jgi:peptidoglycan/LPS O-acetylase OafA/YrhL
LRTFTLALAVLVLFAGSASSAGAHTYNHGKTVWFSDVTIGDGDEVRGDLVVVFGSATCTGGGIIDGNVRTYFGSFEQLDGCAIGGRVIDAFNDDGSFESFVPWFAPRDQSFDAFRENRELYLKMGWDIVVLFVFLLFPVRVRLALDRVERHPGLSAAAGTLALVAVLPVGVLLVLSLIGLPLIVVEFAAVLAGIWIGQAAVALLVGRRLYELLWPHGTPSPLVALVLGLVVVSAAQTLPVVGWAVTALVWLVGLGAAILAFVRDSSFQAFRQGAAAGAAAGGPPMNRPA